MHAFTIPVLIVAFILSGWWLITTLKDSETPLASKIIATILLFLSASAIVIHFTIGFTNINTVEMTDKEVTKQKIIFEKARNSSTVIPQIPEEEIIIEKAQKRVEELKSKTDKETLDKVTEDSDKQLKKLLESINQ